MSLLTRRGFLTTSAVLGLASNLEAAAPRTKPLLPRIFVSAHRGGMGFPDNTPEIIETSVKLGVTAAELDVTVSTDNKLPTQAAWHLETMQPVLAATAKRF